MHQNTLTSNVPWWKFGHVWLVIAGPAIVVVASFITLYLAITRPDPVVSEDYYRKGIEINKTLGDEVDNASMTPAIQARNHAQTGVLPMPKSISKP
ncbi:MAG: FixH family protein [Burkholderiaceae bacterium]|nr:FixH family protein [Burkholderiaceae bacterium]